MKTRFLLPFLIWALSAMGAVAQVTPPPPNLPLSGNEIVTCIQSNVPKGCTTGEIGTISSTVSLNITRAQIPSTLIGANKTVTVNGYATAGDPGFGATYTSTGATSTGWGAIQDSGGTWFNLVFVNGISMPGWFGAKGDNGATTISSGDIAAHPEWRGCYVSGDTWDTVGLYEGILAGFAGNSTPCVSSTTRFLWNITQAVGNLRYVIPTAVSSYGINETLFWAASGAVWQQSSSACINWIGDPTVTPMKTDSVSFFQWSGRPCIINNMRAATAAVGAPVWTMDHDGSSPGGVTTQEVLVENGLFSVGGLNEQGIAINPVGGSAAEGANIVFNNTVFICNAGQAYAIWNNGANALANVLQGGDMEGCSQDGIKNVAGNFNMLASTTENQDLRGYFFTPRGNQFVRNGADFHSFGAVTTAVSRVNNDRSESDVAILCIGGCIANLGVQMAQADLSQWVAQTSNLVGSPVISSAAPGHIFMIADTGGMDGPNQGFRDANIASSTACTITDSGSPGWTTNQWLGDALFWRFTNGFSAHVGPVLWNSGTQVSWCVKTSSQISGSTLTVNSISLGGPNIAVGDTVIAPNVPTQFIVRGSISTTTLTVTQLLSEFAGLVPGGILVGPGVSAGTQIVNQISGSPGGIGTYTVSISQTVPSAKITQQYVTITGLGSGSGGTGTYTLSQSLPVIGASTMEIGPVSLFTIQPPADEMYAIIGQGGMTTPPFAGVTGQHVLGQADGGNSGAGVSTVQGSSTITIGAGLTPNNGDWIMIPNGTTVGDPVTYPSSAALNTGFFAQLSGCSGSTCTMSVPADVTLTHVSAYESPGISDGQLTWMDLDANILQGMSEATNVVFNSGRVQSVGRVTNLTTLRPDWNRGGVFPNAIGGSTNPNFNTVTGFADRSVFTCGAPSGTETWPTGATNDLTCSMNFDFTLVAPPTTTGHAAYLTFNTIEPSTVAHTVTFDSSFVIPPQFTRTYTTSGTASDERSFIFVEDGTNGYVEIAGPNLIGSVPGVWPSLTLSGTSQTFSLTNGLFMRVRRSNSGTAMTDTLPAAGAVGLVNGTQINLVNSDTRAADTVSAGAGTTISAGIAGASAITVLPGRDLWLAYDLPNTTWRSIANSAVVFIPPARVTGNWYITPTGVNGFNAASTTTAYFTPLLIYKAVSVQALGTWLVTGQAAGAIQLAIYPDNGSGTPLLTGGPLVSTSNITATASGLNVSGAVTPATLQPGLYWQALMGNNAGLVLEGLINNPTNFASTLAGAPTLNGLQSAAGVFFSGYTLSGQTFGTWPTSGSPTGSTAIGPLVAYQSQ